MTAASAETPDSYELFKVVVTTDSHSPPVTQQDAQGVVPAGQQQQQSPQSQRQQQQQTADPEDLPAEAIDPNKHFADLHNRLQSIMKHLSALQRDVRTYQVSADAHHAELLARYDAVEKGRKFPFDQITSMDRRIDGLEHVLQMVKADVGDKEWKRHLAELKTVVSEGHDRVLEGVQGVGSGALGWWALVAAVAAVQSVGLVGYIVYMKKVAPPKKYL